MKQKSNLAKNTIMLSLGSFMTKGINLVMIPLFSSWLSTNDYGSFDLFCTYVSLLIPFITLSNSDAIFRFAVEKESEKDKSKYITAGFFINVINTAIVCVVLLVVKQLTGWRMAMPFIVLLISNLVNNHLQGVTRAIRKLSLYSIGNVFSTLGIAACVTVFVRFMDMGLNGIIYGYALGHFVGAIFIILSTKYWRYIRLSGSELAAAKELIKYAYPLIPNNISWWVINVSDRICIKIFLGAYFNGIYAIAYKIPNFCASIFNMFNISWQEVAVEVVNAEDRNMFYNKVYNTMISTLISLCGGLLSLNYFLFAFVFDQRYVDARLFTPILITSVIFGSLTQYFGGIQISLKRTKENGLTTMLGAVVNVIINLLLIRSIGLYAAALSTVIANIVICAVRYTRLDSDICFRLNKRTWLFIVYYLYLLAASYVYAYFWFSTFNLALACVMFCVINQDFVRKILRKLSLQK